MHTYLLAAHTLEQCDTPFVHTISQFFQVSHVMVPLTAAAAATLLGGSSCSAVRVLGCCAVGLRGFLQQQQQQHRQHHRLASIQPGTESLQPAQHDCVGPAWPKLTGLVPLQYWGTVQQPSHRLPPTWLGSSSSTFRGFVTTSHAAADAGDAPTEPPRRRRRSATESHTALRRTTVRHHARVIHLLCCLSMGWRITYLSTCSARPITNTSGLSSPVLACSGTPNASSFCC